VVTVAVATVAVTAEEARVVGSVEAVMAVGSEAAAMVVVMEADLFCSAIALFVRSSDIWQSSIKSAIYFF
jgi:hypothetical protein